MKILDEDGKLFVGERKSKKAPRKEVEKENVQQKRVVKKHKICNCMLHAIQSEIIQCLLVAGGVFVA